MYYLRRCIMGIGLHNYGGWEVAQFSVCKLEKQENWWCNSARSWKAWESRANYINSSLSLKTQEQGGQCQGQEKMAEADRTNSPCSVILFHSVPHRIGWCSPGLVSVILSQSADSVLISSRHTLTDTPRNNVLPAIWVSLSLVKSSHKINHHRVLVTSWAKPFCS